MWAGFIKFVKWLNEIWVWKNVPSTGDSSSGFNKSQANGIWNHPSDCKDSGEGSRSPHLVRAHRVPGTALSIHPVSTSRCEYCAHLTGETVEAQDGWGGCLVSRSRGTVVARYLDTGMLERSYSDSRAQIFSAELQFESIENHGKYIIHNMEVTWALILPWNELIIWSGRHKAMKWLCVGLRLREGTLSTDFIWSQDRLHGGGGLPRVLEKYTVLSKAGSISSQGNPKAPLLNTNLP